MIDPDSGFLLFRRDMCCLEIYSSNVVYVPQIFTGFGSGHKLGGWDTDMCIRLGLYWATNEGFRGEKFYFLPHTRSSTGTVSSTRCRPRSKTRIARAITTPCRDRSHVKPSLVGGAPARTVPQAHTTTMAPCTRVGRAGSGAAQTRW